MLRAIALAAGLTIGAAASAGTPGVTCPSADLFSGGVVSKVCWRCMFPITIGGAPVGDPGSYRNIPHTAAGPTCYCPSRAYPYIWTPGLTASMWEPAHIIEMVRTPGCSPTLGTSFSTAASSSSIFTMSSMGAHQEGETERAAYYNTHYFLFPLAKVLDMFQDAVCSNNWGYDLDVLYMSEIDPTWRNEEISIYQTPEAVLFANPIAETACIADAVAATADQPIDPLFWCAGANHIYPFSGLAPQSSRPSETMTLAAKELGQLFRRGLTPKTMGYDAVCVDHPFPNIVKSQFKLQRAYPIPEIVSNHWIGQNPFTWGEWREVPGIGEDTVEFVWRYQQCCMNP